MNTPPPKQPLPSQRSSDESQIRAWLKLRRELAELHSQLVYLNLIMSLGVRQTRVEASTSRTAATLRDSAQRKTNM